MADNFLERQYDDYLARKAQAEKQRRLKWQKRLKAYQASLKQKESEQSSAAP